MAIRTNSLLFCVPSTVAVALVAKAVLLVLRDLWAGKTRFSEFLESPEGIATNILAARLESLVGGGLVAREPEEGRVRTYALTDKGMSLRPVLTAMRDWGLAHIPGTEARIKPRSGA